MNESYLKVMTKSLEKKIQILDRIIEQNHLQAQIIREQEGSLDEFEKTLEKKEELIKELDYLDAGFETLYGRVKEELLSGPGRYEQEIGRLKELIREITEKSTKIQAEEERNRQAAVNFINAQRKGIQTARTSVRAATDYYKSMSRVNTIDPQMMDKRK